MTLPTSSPEFTELLMTNIPKLGPILTPASIGNLAGIGTFGSSPLSTLTTFAWIVGPKKRRLDIFFTSFKLVRQQSPKAKMLFYTDFAFPFVLGSEPIT